MAPDDLVISILFVGGGGAGEAVWPQSEAAKFKAPPQGPRPINRHYLLVFIAPSCRLVPLE